MHPLLRPFWTAYEYLAMLLGLSFLALLCLVWLPFALLLRPLFPGRRGRRFGRAMIAFGFRIYLGFLHFVCASRFDLATLDRLRQAPPQILIANHPSLLDAVMIVSRLPNTVCVMKAGLMHNILLGSAARLAGYITNKGPLEMILQAGQALDEGAHILLFPEGSRTADLPLDPFSTSAALIARRSRVPVQSLLIRFCHPASESYLGKNWPLWRRPPLPQRWTITPGPCFDPHTLPVDDANRMTAIMETALREQLNQTTPS